MRALILAGGSGTRFWPLSRRERPKQLLALEGEGTLLRGTVDRLDPVVGATDVWVCTTEALAPAVRKELPGVPSEQILGEPEGRNTAAAIGWALDRMDVDDVVAVLPADHRVADGEAFRAALVTAATAAESPGRVITLGIEPRWAETGYGYLEIGEPLADGLREVVRFTEKPEPETARSFVASGRYLWNAGIFVFRSSTLRELLRAHLPELARGLDAIREAPERTTELYARLPRVSIDHGVMEKAPDLATLPLDCGWSDLGSWEALYEVLAGAKGGNVERGDVLAIDSHDSLLVADQGTVAVIGVDRLVVVRCGDAVLVMPRDRSQELRRLVEELRSRGREELL